MLPFKQINQNVVLVRIIYPSFIFFFVILPRGAKVLKFLKLEVWELQFCDQSFFRELLTFWAIAKKVDLYAAVSDVHIFYNLLYLLL